MSANRLIACVLATSGAWALAGVADAADLPLKARPKPAAVHVGGFYFWADASYQSIPLPGYDLGWFTGNNPVIAVERHNPRVNGVGASGGVGFFLPHGTLPGVLGADARIEVSAHHVAADSTANGGAFLTIAAGAQLANGALIGGVGCNPGTPCRTASSLQSDYSAWRLELKGASDIKQGPLTLTPSVALFGGTARTEQEYNQLLTAAVTIGNYAASSALDWTDVGVKAGLQGRYDVTPTVVVGVSGTLGVASRSVDLRIADSYVTLFGNGASVLATSSEATPVIANLEASLHWRWSPLWSARVFGGWNYDSKVPGIVRPNVIAGNLIPATIAYESLTSWYIGGGGSVKLGP